MQALATDWIQEVIRATLGRRLGQHRAGHHPLACARDAVRPGSIAARRVKRVEPSPQSSPLVLVKEVETDV